MLKNEPVTLKDDKYSDAILKCINVFDVSGLQSIY